MTSEPFAYECELDVRYSDLDTVGIVNNAVYVTFLEEARTRFLRDELGVVVESTDQVLAHLDMDFERPIHGQDGVSAGVRVESVGSSSYTLSYELRWQGDVVATAETVQVVVDDDGRPRDVPEPWRDALDEHVVQ
ncbi:acyl-CoA thioesterase [Halocalculus aciditolerans]|uniref:Thioesterase n=1 Tax=Halocalculus aciditolerans TaxID=1383812 RepID=A0A830F2T8_9EURY|nr:thioesterase family protein [Halocalculus aciditolerans]GGL57172.1 thioesterase [Halocalculus aciditolerans]